MATTLAALTLQIARLVTQVSAGSATAVSATSVTDDVNLTQPNGTFDKGTIWLLSGSHAGKVRKITSFITNKVVFATLTTAPTVGDRFALIPRWYPYDQIVAEIGNALALIRVTNRDATLVATAGTLKYTLPTGISHVFAIKTIKPGGTEETPNTHGRELNGSITFANGYEPAAGSTIVLYTEANHPDLVDWDDEVDDEVNIDWLQYEAAMNLLMWGDAQFGNDPKHNIQRRLERINAQKEGLPKLVIGPRVKIVTGDMQ